MIKRKQDYPPLELSVGNSEFPTGCRAQFNGNISEIQWKNAQTATLSAYGFTYDKLNRLKTSHYGEGTLGTTNSGAWDEDLSYDFNGNIMSLVRDAAGTNVDNLTYNYSGTGNKLNYVTDGASYSGEENHFKDGNPGTSTDYTYDDNGNMNQDKNKGISSIAYNHLNLPKLITFANGNTIEYIYDATGVKLEKIVKESGQTDKITDYVGGVVYEDNVRKFMSTEEGRIMLESTPEYQYHMKDHLGNVRLTFTTASSAQQTSTYLATMETEVTTLEAATFNNIEETQTEDKIYNHTPGGKASARLNAVEDRVMGPSMTLQVMPGDTVRMKVQAKYFKKAKSKDPIAGMASIVAASMGAGTISEAPQIAQGIQETLGLGQAGLVSKDNTIPKAYINYLFFDKENTFKKGGYKQVSEAALGSFEELDLEYVPEEEGTIMIYTANQTAEDLDVYMDDLTILHTEGPIIRVDDYYPFGLTFNTSERTGYTTNNFLYNSKEWQDDLDLDWYDYGARMYDAAIGRWHVTDGKSELYFANSPYVYALNNPINAVDPDGNLVIFINGLGGGGKNYWKSWTSTPIYIGRRSVGRTRSLIEFDELVMDQLDDHSPIYLDGSPSYLASNISPFFRWAEGFEDGNEMAKQLIESLARDPQGNITESIKIITHSMGGVYAKGFVRAIKNYIRNSDDPKIRKVLISLVADFDPFQAGSHYGTADSDIYTMQFINAGWWDLFNFGGLANQKEEEADEVEINENKTSHFIETFTGNISELEEGTYEWDNEKEEWVCTSCN